MVEDLSQAEQAAHARSLQQETRSEMYMCDLAI